MKFSAVSVLVVAYVASMVLCEEVSLGQVVHSIGATTSSNTGIAPNKDAELIAMIEGRSNELEGNPSDAEKNAEKIAEKIAEKSDELSDADEQAEKDEEEEEEESVGAVLESDSTGKENAQTSKNEQDTTETEKEKHENHENKNEKEKNSEEAKDSPLEENKLDKKKSDTLDASDHLGSSGGALIDRSTADEISSQEETSEKSEVGGGEQASQASQASEASEAQKSEENDAKKSAHDHPLVPHLPGAVMQHVEHIEKMTKKVKEAQQQEEAERVQNVTAKPVEAQQNAQNARIVPITSEIDAKTLAIEQDTQTKVLAGIIAFVGIVLLALLLCRNPSDSASGGEHARLDTIPSEEACIEEEFSSSELSTELAQMLGKILDNRSLPRFTMTEYSRIFSQNYLTTLEQLKGMDDKDWDRLELPETIVCEIRRELSPQKSEKVAIITEL